MSIVIGSGPNVIGVTTSSFASGVETFNLQTRSLDMNNGTQRHFTSNNDGDDLTLTNLNEIIQGGSLDASETAGAGGHVSIYASGNVALSNILTYGSGAYAAGGYITLESGGTVNLSGYLKSHAGSSARGGVVTISGTSISVGDDGTHSILTGGNGSNRGDASLYGEGAITLTGAIDTHSAVTLTGGVVKIQGNIAGTVYAGEVSVGGDIDTWGALGGEDVTILSRSSVIVSGNIEAYSEHIYAYGGDVFIFGSNAVTITGYVGDNGGTVTISGSRITIGDDGTNSIVCRGNSAYMSEVGLYSTGIVALTGGVSAYNSVGGKTGGVVTIQGNIAGTVYAGNVSVGGDIDTWGAQKGDDVTIKSRGSVTVSGNIESYSEGSYVHGGDVFIFASNSVTIAGFIDTHLQGNGGSAAHGGGVVITGATVTVSGTNSSGISVDTRGVGVGSRGSNVVITATSGDITIGGGIDATGNGAQPDGYLRATANNGRISIGELDLNKLASVTFSVGEGRSVSVLALVNFNTAYPASLSEFEENSDVYYDETHPDCAYLDGNTFPIHESPDYFLKPLSLLVRASTFIVK